MVLLSRKQPTNQSTGIPNLVGGGGRTVGGQGIEGTGVPGVAGHTGLAGVDLYQASVDCIQDNGIGLRAGHLRGVIYDD